MVTRQVEVEFEGESRSFEEAARRSAQRTAQLERQVERLERRLQSYRTQVERTAESQRRQSQATEAGSLEMKGGLMALAAAAAAVSAPVAAAGTSFAVFAAVAAPSIIKVISAQQDLVGSWDTLSSRQKTSSLIVKSLTDDFGKLSESYEPQALAAFNSVVLSTRSLMPELNRIMDRSAFSVQEFTGRIGDFVTGKDMTGFLRFTGDNAPKALHELGTAATTTGSLALTMAQNMAPLGFSILSVANGALGLVNGLAHVNPLLSQFALTALLVRAPVTAAVSGIAALSGHMTAFAAANAGATRSAKALNLVTKAAPALYLVAGAAVVFLAVKLMQARTETEKLVTSLAIQNRAVGNNIAGYQAMHEVLSTRLNVAMAQQEASHQKLINSGGKLGTVNGDLAMKAGHNAEQQHTLREALERNDKSIRNITTGANQLAVTYGITSTQAVRLADAAGVDLSTSITKSGQLTNEAATKMDRYRQAVEMARDPLRLVKIALDDAGNSALTMTDRLKAATAALDAIFNPSIAAFKATTQLKSGFQELIKQMDAAHGRMTGNSAASRALRAAFASQLETVRDLYLATLTKTKSEARATAVVREQLPVLQALAGRNKDARAQVDALAASTGVSTGRQKIAHDAFVKTASSMGIARTRAEALWREYSKLPGQTSRAAAGVQHFSERTIAALHNLHDKDLNVTVTADGKFRHATTAGLAAGGPVRAISPGATRAYDSQPAVLRVDEHVWTPEEVDAVGGHQAMYRMRKRALAGDLQGYAAGGAVTFGAKVPSAARTSQVVASGAVHQLFKDFTAATEQALSLAAAWKKFAANGGPVVQAARSQIGLPYSWGGGGPGGPSRGFAQGANTVGFDCSSLMQYAWWQGAHKSISRTTYSQRQVLPRISSPIPGAVGQPHPGHTYMYSGNGRIIEAAQTGTRISEHALTRSTPWWGYPKAKGGPVQRAMAADFVHSGKHAGEVKMLGLAGDPGGIGDVPRFASGGFAAGYAHGPTLLGERETGGEAYIPLAAGKRSRSEDVVAEVARRFGGMYVTGGQAPRASGTTVVHRTVNVMPGARNTIRDEVDVHLLAGKVDWLDRTGFG